MDYHNLPRKQLQALCKKHEIPANQTNVQMADALTALLKVDTKPKSGAGQKQAAAEEDVRDESSVLTENSNVPKVKATRSKRQETKDFEEEDCEQFAASAEDDGEEKTENNRARGSQKLRSKPRKDDKDEVVVVEEIEKPRTRGAREEKISKVSEPSIRGVEKVAVKKTDNANKKNASADDNCDEVARDHSEEEKGFKREATLRGKENRSRQLRHLTKKAESIEQPKHKVTDVSGAEEYDEVEVVEEAVKPRNRGSRSERAGKGTVPDISGLEEVRKKVDTKKKNVPELDISKDCREGEQGLKDDAALQSKDNGRRQLRHSRKKVASVEESENKEPNVAQTEKDAQEEIVMKVDKKKNKTNASEGENVHDKADDLKECEQGLKGEGVSHGKYNDARQTRHLRRKPESDNKSVNKMVDAAEPEVKVSSKRTTRANASKVNQINRPAITTKAAVKSLDEEEETNGNTSESSCKSKTTNVRKLEKSPVVIDLVDSDDDENLAEKEDMSEQSKIFVHSKNADTKKAGKGTGKMMPCQKTLRARQSKVSVEIHANNSEVQKHEISSRGHKGGEKEEMPVNGCAKGRNESEATVNPSTSVKQAISRRRGKDGHKEELVDPSSVEDTVEAANVSDETTVAENKETLIASALEHKDEAVAVSVEPAVNHVITRRGRKGCLESHTTSSTKELKNNVTDVYVENSVDASESSKTVVTRRLQKSGHIMQEVVNGNKLDRVDASESPKQVVTPRGRMGVHNVDEAVNANNVGCRGRNGRKKEVVNSNVQEDKEVAAEVNASAQPLVNTSVFTKQVVTQRGRKGCQKDLLVNTSLVEEKKNGADNSVVESLNATIEQDMTNMAQKISSCEADGSHEDETITDSRKLENKKDGSKSKTRTQRRQQLVKDLMSPDNANMMEDDKKRLQTVSDATCPSMRAITSRQEQRKTRGAISEIPRTRHKIKLETVNKSGDKKGHCSSEGDGLQKMDCHQNFQRKASATQSYSKDHTEEGAEEKEVKEEHDAEKQATFQCKEKTVKFSTDDNRDEAAGSISKRDTEEITYGQLDVKCVIEKETKFCGVAEEGLGDLIGEVYSNSEKDVVEGICMSVPLEESLEECPVTELSETMNAQGSEFVIAVESNINEEREKTKLVDINEEEEIPIKDEKIGDWRVIGTLDNGAFQTVKAVNGDDIVEDGHSERELGDKYVSQDCDVEVRAVSEIDEIDDGGSLMGEHGDFENDNLAEFFDPVEEVAEPMEEESDPSCESGEDESIDYACYQEDEDSDVEQKVSDLDSCPQSDELLLDGHKSQHISSETDDDEDGSQSYEEDCDSDAREDETDDDNSSHSDSFNGSDIEEEFPVLHPCKQNDNLIYEVEHYEDDLRKTQSSDNFLSQDNVFVFNEVQNDSAVKHDYYEHEPRCSSCNNEELYYSDSEEFEHEEKIDASDTGMPNDGILQEDEADKFELDDSGIRIDSDNEETLVAGKQIEDKPRELDGSEKSRTLYDKSYEGAQNDSDVREELYAEASDQLESQIQQPSKTMDCGALLTEEDEMIETTTEIRTSHVGMNDLFRNISSDNRLCHIIPEVGDQNNKISGLLDSKVSPIAQIHGEKIGDTDSIDEQHTCISAPDKLPGKEENEAEQSETCTKNGNTTEVGSVYNGDSNKVLAKVEENAVETSCSDLKIKFDESGSYESHDQGKVNYCEVEGDTNVILFSGLNDDSPNNQEIQEHFSSSTVDGEVQLTEKNSITMDVVRSISTEKINVFTNCNKIFHCSAMNDSALEQSPKILSTELDVSRSDSLLKMSYRTEGHDWSPCLNSLFVDEFVATSEKVELELSESKGTNPCSDLNESAVEDCQDTLSTEACKLEFRTLKDPELSSDTELFHCSDGSAMEQSDKEVLPTKLSLQGSPELDTERSGTNDPAVEAREKVLPTEPCKLEFYELDSECPGISYSITAQRQEVGVTEPCKQELVRLDSPCSATEERLQVILSQPCKRELSQSDTPLKMSENPKGYDMTQMQPDIISNANVSICSGMDDYAIEKSEEVSSKQPSELDFSQIDSPSKISDHAEGYEISPSLRTLCSLLKKLEIGSRTDVPTFSGVDDSVMEQNTEILPIEACNLELPEFSTTSGMDKLTKDHDVSPSSKITNDVVFFSGIIDSIVKQRQQVFPADVSNQKLSPFRSTLMMTESPKGYEMSPCLNTLFVEESDTTIKIHEPKNVIDSLIGKQEHFVATEVYGQELSQFGNMIKILEPSEVHEMPPSNTLLVEEFCPSTEILVPVNNTDSLVKQSQEIVAPEIDSPMKMPGLIKGYEKSPCLSTLFVEEFGTSLKMGYPTNQNNSVNEKSQMVFPIEQKISPCLNSQPTKMKMADLTKELEMSSCLNTLFAEMSSTPLKMPEPISITDISSASSAVDDSSLLQMNQILPTAACKHEISQISPHSNSTFEHSFGTPMGKPELEENNNLFDCAGMFDASEQSIEILATEDPKEDAYEQEHSKINTQAKVAKITKEFEMSPCLNTLFGEVSSIPSKMPEPTSNIDVAPSLGVDDSSLLEMNDILPTEACKHEISQISPVFEESFGTLTGEPDLAGNNNLFDCAGVYDAAEKTIEILETEASKQDACEPERSIFDTQMKMTELSKEFEMSPCLTTLFAEVSSTDCVGVYDAAEQTIEIKASKQDTQMKMAELTKGFEMSPCLNTLFAEVSTTDLSSPCLGMDDSSLQELNETLVAEACKREIYRISPRSNAMFEQSPGTSMEIFSAEASGQDHYEPDIPMKKGHPTEGQELSPCLSIPSGQDSNSSKKTSEMNEVCEKDLDCIQEPSLENISSEKPQLGVGQCIGKLEQYITPLKTVELTERSDVLQRSLVAGAMKAKIQFIDERESEQSLVPEIPADHVQFADGDTWSCNVAAAGKESKPTSRIWERLANLNNRLQGMQKGLEGHMPSSYCTPARRLKPSKGSASAKSVKETMSVSRSRLSAKGDKEAFMKENPNDFTQHSFQQLKSLAKEKDFDKSVTKRAALQNLSSNALEHRADSVGKPFPSDERTLTIHEDQCS